MTEFLSAEQSKVQAPLLHNIYVIYRHEHYWYTPLLTHWGFFSEGRHVTTSCLLAKEERWQKETVTAKHLKRSGYNVDPVNAIRLLWPMSEQICNGIW